MRSGSIPKRKSSVEINDEWWLNDAETNEKECSQVNAFIETNSLNDLISDLRKKRKEFLTI